MILLIPQSLKLSLIIHDECHNTTANQTFEFLQFMKDRKSNIIGIDIKKIDLKHRIETLEDKVALNLDEKLYSELLSLRNQLKSG